MVVVVAVVWLEGLSDGTKTAEKINEERRTNDLEQLRVFSLVLSATNDITPTLLVRLYALLIKMHVFRVCSPKKKSENRFTLNGNGIMSFLG